KMGAATMMPASRPRLTTDVPPITVLLVLQGEKRARTILSAHPAIHERPWEPGSLDVRYTTAGALAARGPLAPIWRDPAGQGTAEPLLVNAVVTPRMSHFGV